MRSFVLAVVAALCACKAPVRAAPPADPALARVPEGYGRPYAADLVLSVKERALLLPGNRACGLTDVGCTQALAALQGRSLALELDPALPMADLSVPLSRLSEALGNDGAACLTVSDAKELRCLPFRPLSGEQFGAWLDADKPLGKIRVVMRSDGLEVVTDRGKVPGDDRFGPSLPPLAGRPDFEGLDRLLSRVARRFPDEDEAVLAPSPSMRIGEVSRALGAMSGPGGERFPKVFLVYP
jgi:hypothetical protein